MSAFDRDKLDESLWYVIACASKVVQSVSERSLINTVFSFKIYQIYKSKIALTEEMIRRSLNGLIGEGKVTPVMRGGERYLFLSHVQWQALGEEIEQEKFKNGLMREANSSFTRRGG